MTGDLRFLWLLRHAKAEPERAGGSDHARVLTPRGRHDAADLAASLEVGPPALGLGAEVALPSIVLTSTADRTRQTARLVAAGLPPGVPIEECRDLYGAETDGVLARVREVDDSCRSVLVVGHNPTISAVLWRALDPDRVPAAGSEVPGESLPTCGLAVLAFSAGGWDGLRWGSATLLGSFGPPYALA